MDFYRSIGHCHLFFYSFFFFFLAIFLAIIWQTVVRFMDLFILLHNHIIPSSCTYTYIYILLSEHLLTAYIMYICIYYINKTMQMYIKHDHVLLFLLQKYPGILDHLLWEEFEDTKGVIRICISSKANYLGTSLCIGKMWLDCTGYCKPTYFRGYYVSHFSTSRQFRGDLNSR